MSLHLNIELFSKFHHFGQKFTNFLSVYYSFGNILKLYCKFLMLFRSLTWIMTDICYFGHNYIENSNNHFRYILNVP